MPRTRSLAWSELKLGIVGVVAIVLATAMVLAVGGEGGFFADRYPLKTKFRDVQGLKPGAVVRLGGKEVGLVTAVEFAGNEIEVAMEIRSEIRPLITDQSTAIIGSLSLLGEPIVDIRSTGQGTPLSDWAYVRGDNTGGPIAEITESAQAGLVRAEQILASVQEGRGTIGKLVTDDALYVELNRFIASAQDVTRAMNRGDGTLGALLKDPAAYNSLKTSLANLQDMTARINAGQGALGRFLNDEKLANSLSTTLTNLDQVTGKMNTGSGTVGRLMNESQLYDRLNSLSGRLDQTLAGLESGRGTAGKLLHDDRLYESINTTVAEFRSMALEFKSLIAEIKKDPKKYLRVSVSIF
jgi:phospholipid/cholesterol/gamma-HCH transport system substrate-binding protein